MRIILKLIVSLKSAVALISLLTLLSMTGTFVPQNLEAAEYLRRYPQLGHWLIALGFDDMYRCGLFQASLWLLALSTVACIMTRWKNTVKKLRGRIAFVSGKEICASACSRKITVSSDDAWQGYFAQRRDNEDGSVFFLRATGRISLLGGMSIHLGLLAILAGALIGMFYGVETAVRGSKGEQVVVAPLEAVRAARDADRISRQARNIRSFSPEDPRLDQMRAEVEKLHHVYAEGMASPSFRVVFDELWVDHYEDADGAVKGVKGWNSKVRFIDEQGESEPVVIKVNQPVSYKDFTFYQASWNKTFRRIRVKVDMIDNASASIDDRFMAKPASFPLELELKLGEPVKPEWARVELVLHDFLPDFRIIGDRLVSVSHELNNPAARIVAYGTDGNIAGRAWAFPEDRVMQASHVSNMPFVFTFVEAEPDYESGMQMAYDPGKPVVWLGCLLFTLGMICSFYIPYREEWLILYPDRTAFVAITGNRPPTAYSADLQNLESVVCQARQKDEQQ
jgi:cytochrome c biogenesis protein